MPQNGAGRTDHEWETTSHTPEQVIRKLREGEKLIDQGMGLAGEADHHTDKFDQAIEAQCRDIAAAAKTAP